MGEQSNNAKDDAAKAGSGKTARLHRLIDDLCDLSITSEDLCELNGRLESDEESRIEYLNHIGIEAQLCSLYIQPDSTSQQFPFTPSGNSELAAAAQTAPLAVWSIRQMFAIAAAVAIVATGASWITYQAATQRTQLAQNAGAGSKAQPLDFLEEEAVATITGTRNCLWRGDDSTAGYGSSLFSGQLLDLEAGVAEVTFASGARVVLEGPASFRIPDADSAELITGRMAASVPRDSSNFSIRTPRVAINNSNAQFGLVAGPHGLSEVHVFEGSVEAMLFDEQGRKLRQVNLADHDAAKLAPRSSEVTLAPADSLSFIRSLAASTGPAGGLLAIEEFDYPVGPLAWQNGGFGWAGPWADIEAASESLGAGAAESNGVGEGSLSSGRVHSLGNRAQQTGQANRIRRTLSTSIGGVFDAANLIESQDGLRLVGREGTTVYLSFLQRVSRTDDVFYGFELHRGDGNFNRVLCIGNGVEESGYGVTSNYNAYLGDKCQLLGQENTETNFYIVKIEFGANNQDVATVYRNPVSLEDESKCAATATLHGNFAFDRVSVANFNGSKTHEVDEVRVGVSFHAVTVERGQLDVPLALLDSAASEDKIVELSEFLIKIPLRVELL